MSNAETVFEAAVIGCRIHEMDYTELTNLPKTLKQRTVKDDYLMRLKNNGPPYGIIELLRFPQERFR
ncbi:hypothetical protein ASE64_15270 [Agreia sp. Leaf210]|nr:hypothetical protein ASE64_15270 [Agreia sp. Leaf210]